MAHEIEFDIHRVNASEESTQRMREMLADKDATLHTLCSASITLEAQSEPSTGHAPPTPADETVLLARSTHIITTELYVDSGGHVHVVTFDEHTTTSGTVLAILSDVPIN